MSEVVTSAQSRRLFHKLCSRGFRNGQEPCQSSTAKQIVVVADTLLYRYLAMTWLHQEDRAIEIGCSYGHCTSVFRCKVLGVDIAPEKVEQASKKYPECDFACEDVFGNNLTWLQEDTTALFLDIGGGRNYKPVMEALAICIPILPKLRLVVAKSTEVSRFLLRVEDSIYIFAHDLTRKQHSDAETLEEIANDIRRLGGELPLSFIYTHLCCSPRLRYLAGKDRVQSLLKGCAPLLQLVEVPTGPPDLRVRVRAAPGEVSSPPDHIVSPVLRELEKKTFQCVAKSSNSERFLAGILGNIKKSLLRRYLAVASDPALHRQASDPSLDPRCLEPWSDAWRSSVALRHLHAFISSSSSLAFVSATGDDVPTYDELCKLKVICNAEFFEQLDDSVNFKAEDIEGERIELQVLGSNWSVGQGDTPEINDVFVEHAWVLVAGHVVEESTRGPGKELDECANPG